MSKNNKATIKDIAELAGVSQSTVSMILNGKISASFSEETIRKVVENAYKLNYKVKEKSETFFEQSTKLFAVIAPTISNPYYPALIQAIEKAALERGYNLFVCTTYRDAQLERKYLEILSHSGICGLIFTFLPINEDYVKQMSIKIPVVIVGDKTESNDMDTVSVNSFSAAKIITEHLLSLGHRRIAFITYRIDTTPPFSRLEGIKSALKASEFETKLIIKETEQDLSSNMFEDSIEIKVGYDLTLDLIEKEDVTAIIAVNDLVAYGVLDALAEKGFDVPKDYSVCGFDNIFPSALSGISLTTVDRFISHKGASVVEILVKNIASRSEPLNPTSVFNVEYKPMLIKRRTTGICERS